MENLIFHTDHLFLENNVKTMKSYPEENMPEKENIPKKKICRKKENMPKKENMQEIPETGMTILRRRHIPAQTIEEWIASLKENYPR